MDLTAIQKPSGKFNNNNLANYVQHRNEKLPGKLLYMVYVLYILYWILSKAVET